MWTLKQPSLPEARKWTFNGFRGKRTSQRCFHPFRSTSSSLNLPALQILSNNSPPAAYSMTIARWVGVSKTCKNNTYLRQSSKSHALSTRGNSTKILKIIAQQENFSTAAFTSREENGQEKVCQRETLDTVIGFPHSQILREQANT